MFVSRCVRVYVCNTAQSCKRREGAALLYMCCSTVCFQHSFLFLFSICMFSLNVVPKATFMLYPTCIEQECAQDQAAADTKTAVQAKVMHHCHPDASDVSSGHFRTPHFLLCSRVVSLLLLCSDFCSFFCLLYMHIYFRVRTKQKAQRRQRQRPRSRHSLFLTRFPLHLSMLSFAHRVH